MVLTYRWFSVPLHTLHASYRPTEVITLNFAIQLNGTKKVKYMLKKYSMWNE